MRQWRLPITGYSVNELVFGGRVVIRLSGGERLEGELSKPTADLIFYQPFRLDLAGHSEQRLDPEGPWEALTRLFALRHSVVDFATVDSHSGLAVRFEGVGHLIAWSGEQYESWELTGPSTVKVVAMSGDYEPAIWGELEPLGG